MHAAYVPPPILVVAFGNQVFGLDPSSGRRAWTYEAGPKGKENPVRLVVYGARIYAVASCVLHVLEYPTGKLVTTTKVPTTHGTFTLLDGRLYAAGHGEVACFDLEGRLLWHDAFSGHGEGAVALGVPGYFAQGDLT